LLQNIKGVTAVDHIHAWSVTQERPMVTLEIAINETHDARLVKQQVKAMLGTEYNIEHSTVEVV